MLPHRHDWSQKTRLIDGDSLFRGEARIWTRRSSFPFTCEVVLRFPRQQLVSPGFR